MNRIAEVQQLWQAARQRGQRHAIIQLVRYIMTQHTQTRCELDATISKPSEKLHTADGNQITHALHRPQFTVHKSRLATKFYRMAEMRRYFSSKPTKDDDLSIHQKPTTSGSASESQDPAKHDESKTASDSASSPQDSTDFDPANASKPMSISDLSKLLDKTNKSEELSAEEQATVATLYEVIANELARLEKELPPESPLSLGDLDLPETDKMYVLESDASGNGASSSSSSSSSPISKSPKRRGSSQKRTPKPTGDTSEEVSATTAGATSEPVTFDQNKLDEFERDMLRELNKGLSKYIRASGKPTSESKSTEPSQTADADSLGTTEEGEYDPSKPIDTKAEIKKRLDKLKAAVKDMQSTDAVPQPRKSRSLRRAFQERNAAEMMVSQPPEHDEDFSEETATDSMGDFTSKDQATLRDFKRRISMSSPSQSAASSSSTASHSPSLPAYRRGPSPSAPAVSLSQKGTTALPLDPEPSKDTSKKPAVSGTADVSANTKSGSLAASRGGFSGGLLSNAMTAAGSSDPTADVTAPQIPPPQTPDERRAALQLAGSTSTSEQKVRERYAKYLAAIAKIREGTKTNTTELTEDEFQHLVKLLKERSDSAESVLRLNDEQLVLELGLFPNMKSQDKAKAESSTEDKKDESDTPTEAPKGDVEKPNKDSDVDVDKNQDALASSSSNNTNAGNGSANANGGNGDDGNGNGDNKGELPKPPTTYTPVPLNFQPLPHSAHAPRMSTVIAVGISIRPLFPGLYAPIIIRDPALITAIKKQSESPLPYIGVFLKKTQDPALFMKQRGAISPASPDAPPLRLTTLPKTLGSLLNNKDGASTLPESKGDILEEPVKADDLYDVGTFAQIFRTDTLADGSLSVILVGLRRIRSLGPRIRLEDRSVSEKHPEKDEASPDGSKSPSSSTSRSTVLELNVTHAEEATLGSRKSPSTKGTAFVEDPDREYEEELVRAYMSEIMATIREVIKRHHVFQEQLGFILNTIDWHNPESVADICTSLTMASPETLQDVLATWDITQRLNKALLLLRKELELAKLQQSINKTVDESILKVNRKHLAMEQIKQLRKEVGLDNEKDALRKRFFERVKDKQLPVEVAQAITDEFARLATLETSSSEFNVTRNYLDWLTTLPWGDYSADTFDLAAASKILDEDHYGMEDVKQRILEFIATAKLRGATPQGKVMLFVGPPGVGKTSIGKSIARALGREFYRFSVGGTHDVADVKGHRRTYIGALPGRLVQALKRAKTMNPVILIDEIDKMGRSSMHGDPSAALLEVLDPEQNSNFMDHYLDVPLDLSKVLFLCTANTLDTISAPLLDRMDVIRLSGYVAQEKEQIAQNYLIPASRTTLGVSPKAANVTPEAIRHLIKWYSREAGVRNLKNLIDKLYRKVAYQLVKAGAQSSATLVEKNDQVNRARMENQRKVDEAKKEAAKVAEEAKEVAKEVDKASEAKVVEAEVVETKEPHITVDVNNLTDFVGQPVFTEERLYERTPVGVVMGLAWNNAGGAILYLESEIADSFRKMRKAYTEPVPYVVSDAPTKDTSSTPSTQPAPATSGNSTPTDNSTPKSTAVVIPSNPTDKDGDEKSGRGGSLVITGQLGDVMKESTTIAYTLAKSYLARLVIEYDSLKNKPNAVAMPVLETAAKTPLTDRGTFMTVIGQEYARRCEALGEQPKPLDAKDLPLTYLYTPSASFFADHQIHIHVPQGATPKDGPSAGIALVTCLLSQALNRPLVPEIAMTGEITLTGKVLPIGGVKEKLIAAKRAGIHHVIVPRANLADVTELPAYITADMTLYFADVYEHVLRLALGCPDALGGHGAAPPMIKVYPTQAELDAQTASSKTTASTENTSTPPSTHAVQASAPARKTTVLDAAMIEAMF